MIFQEFIVKGVTADQLTLSAGFRRAQAEQPHDVGQRCTEGIVVVKRTLRIGHGKPGSLCHVLARVTDVVQ